MKKTKNSLKIIAILCVFFFNLSCDNDLTRDERSGVVLIINRIVGTDIEGRTADYLISDIITDGAVYTNPVIVSLEAKLKKPDPLAPAASYKTSVMVNRYTITYTSPQGDPVPAAFEGQLSAVIETDSTLDIEILAVRADDKLVPPLSTIGAGYIWAVAEIRIMGHDLEGYPVEAVGYLSVYFADWADP